jgi:hypothetical protein
VQHAAGSRKQEAGIGPPSSVLLLLSNTGIPSLEKHFIEK